MVARPPSTAYRFQKAFRRNKLVFTAATAVAAALVIGLGAATAMFFRERLARKVAQAEQQRADAQASKASESEQQSRRSLYSAEVSLAGEALAADDLNRARELLARQEFQRQAKRTTFAVSSGVTFGSNPKVRN